MPKSRQTCTECSLRRQKCDRKLPCGRCVKRGVPEKCTQKWPGRYDPKIHRVYPRGEPISYRAAGKTSAEGPGDSHPIEADETNLNAGSPEDVWAQASNGAHNGRQQDRRSLSESDGAVITRMGSRGDRFENDEYGHRERRLKDAWNAESALQSWAKEPRLQYQFSTHHPPQIRHKQTEGSNNNHSWVSSTGFHSTVAALEAFLQLLIPSVDQIWHLANYHELCLLWYHGCYHGPTFRHELEQALDGQNDTLTIQGLDLQWVALLFSIMAGTLTCAPWPRLESWGFHKDEVLKLSKQWYKATITCLNQAEYTSKHHIYSIQAIATLTMSAHSLGNSGELSVLLGAAFKIAQSLGLDRLKYDPVLEDIRDSSSDEQRHQVLRREIGRRLWSQLCVQDWLSLPFAESYSIDPLHFTTTKPSSRSHITMAPIPDTFPTYVSYGNYLFEIAKLMVGHHAAMVHSTTKFTKYEHVLDFDSRMRALATKGMPRYFHITDPIDPSWPEWVPWARRSLTICFAHKIIMIHRAFIRDSFTNPIFAITRMTCTAASKTILNEAKQTKDLDGPIIWVDKAFCVAAGIILCLDIFHRSEADAEFRIHRDLVTDCIELLRKFDNSMVAVRGANLLSSLLSDRERLLRSPSENINTSNIFRSLVVNKDVPATPSPGEHIPSSIQMPSLDGSRPGVQDLDLTYDMLAELFPPQAGFCNRFLFENLLRFDRLNA